MVWCQHHNGMFRSTDGAETFGEIDPPPPSGFGFAVAPHPADPLTAWFAPAVKDECRVPVDGRLVVTRTRDGGASFETLDGGLPREASYDLIYRHALVVDREGTGLAMGSTTGNLWLSETAGEDWAQLAGHLPPIAQVAFRPLKPLGQPSRPRSVGPSISASRPRGDARGSARCPRDGAKISASGSDMTNAPTGFQAKGTPLACRLATRCVVLRPVCEITPPMVPSR